MPGRPARVQGRRQFSSLTRSGRRARNGVVTVHFLRAGDEDDRVRVAFSVSRRVGGAVVRNRWRRRLRAIAAELSGGLRPGSYLIAVTPEVTRLTYDQLKDQVSATMRRVSEATR